MKNETKTTKAFKGIHLIGSSVSMLDLAIP